jgi:transcriptional regulator with XRE-family HTH domain
MKPAPAVPDVAAALDHRGKFPARKRFRSRLRNVTTGGSIGRTTDAGGLGTMREPERTGALAALIEAALARKRLSATEASVSAGLNRDAIRDIRRGSIPSAAKLAALAALLELPDDAVRSALGFPPAPVERLPEGNLFASAPGAAPLPLRNPGRSEGGILRDEEIGTVERPEWLVGRRGAYALAVPDDAMAPAMRAGQTAYCDPGRAAAIGDYVRIVPRNGATWIGRLEARDAAGITVRALAERDPKHVAATDLAALHLVVGVLFLRV